MTSWVINFHPRDTYLCSLSVSTASSSNPHQNLLCNFESTKIHSSDDEKKVFGKYSRKFPTSVLKYWESSICRILIYYLACFLQTHKRKYQHRRKIVVLFVLQLKLPILFNILLTMHLPQYYQVNPIFSNTSMILNPLPVIQNADVPNSNF